MPTYYVDLNAIGSGHAGTEIDPFSAHDHFVNVLEGDIVYMKGEADDVRIKGSIYLPWNPGINGPWRINYPIDMNVDYGSLFVGGIINITGSFIVFTSENVAFRNIWLTATNLIIYHVAVPNNDVFEGCLLNLTEGIFGISPVPGSSNYFTDTVFNIPGTNKFSFYGSVVDHFKNCASNIPIVNASDDPYFIGDDTFDVVDCQEDWIPPSLPAWDDPKESFDTSILFADIDTPPQPGNPPYTGYATDLWGNSRTGIGTGFFNQVAPTISVQPDSVTKTVRDTATFSITASGNPSPSYQWYFNNSTMINGGRVSGSTTNILTINNTLPIDVGNYTVVVSNGVAPDATSNVAVLTILLDTFGNGIGYRQVILNDALSVKFRRPFGQTIDYP